MKDSTMNAKNSLDRLSFMRSGLMAGGAATIGAGLLANGTLARAQQQESGGPLCAGDVAILRFLAAAELIEADLWTQYAELGGIGDNPPIEVEPNETLNPYQAALSNLDPDGPQPGPQRTRMAERDGNPAPKPRPVFIPASRIGNRWSRWEVLGGLCRGLVAVDVACMLHV